MDKPTKPTDLIPRSFGGVKNNFSPSLQSSGYEDGVPAIYGGDNLNYQLDATGKELDYCEKICDYIKDIPIGKTITVDSNNKLVYANNIDFSSRHIGEIIISTLPLTDAGLHLLDGARLSGDGIYKDFVDYIADLYAENPSANYFTTESAWQSSVTTYGVCGKFVYDSINNTVRLPKVTGIIEGTTDVTALGDLVEAGLPNIIGRMGNTDVHSSSSTGCFYRSGTSGKLQNADGDKDPNVYFDASLSNPIYGNSNTVQPQAIKGYYYIVIATSTKTDIQVDIDEIATDLNGKADTDLVNITDTGKVMMSGIGMPSSESISLTLGASGSTYTAPSNGYLYCRFTTTGGTGYSWIWLDASGGLQSRNNNYMVNNQTILGCYAWIPVLKGQTVTINYDYVGNISNSDLRFVYAKGSESEAS